MEQLAALFPENKKAIFGDMMKDMKDMFSGQSKPEATEWKDYRFIPGFLADTAKYAFDEMEIKEGSVFIVTYPKTGTNWSLEVVRQIMYGHDAKTMAISKALPPPFHLLEIWKADKFQLMEHIPLNRNLFGSHLPEELVNVERIKKRKGKIIIVLRNPKDQAVSWFHFTQSKSFDQFREEFSSDWNQFFADYTQGKHRTLVKEGEWYPDHILGWYKHKNDKDFLFVHFEDMKKDVKKQIRRIGKFLDIDLSNERVDQIAKDTTFDVMKNAVKKETSEMDKARTAINLMRKGQVGEWKEVFTVAQSEFMDKVFNEKLAATDIKFTYEL